MTRTCIHDLRPDECALCKSNDWHVGIANARRKSLASIETLLQRIEVTLAVRPDENPSYRKTGGYASPPGPPSPLPKVPKGPAPGAKRRDLYGWSGTPQHDNKSQGELMPPVLSTDPADDPPAVIRKYPRPPNYQVPLCHETLIEGGGTLRCQGIRGHRDEHSFLVLWYYEHKEN